MAKNDKRLFGGIDIGGTKILCVVADEEGKILGRGKKKTKADKGLGFEEIMERAVKALKKACSDAEVDVSDLEAVGVGAPSAFLEDGTAVSACNLGWSNEPLVPVLQNMLGKPVYAENDVNMGTLGEYTFGAGKGYKTVIGFFMGTGLGGGIVRHGELMIGENRLASELGHMIVQARGRKCNCDNEGCIEAYASKSGMGQYFDQEINRAGRKSVLSKLCDDNDFSNVKSSILKEAYKKDDEVVKEALDEAAFYLGIGVANLIIALGPDMVVLGGGVMEALGDEMLPKVKEAAASHVWPRESFKDTEFSLAKLEDDAVALGAMVYARESCK